MCLWPAWPVSLPFLFRSSQSGPRNLVKLKEDLWHKLSRKIAPPPQNLALGRECGIVDGMTQITTQFPRTSLPEALTFNLFNLKLSSKAGLEGQAAQYHLPRKGIQRFSSESPKVTGRPIAGAVQSKSSIYTVRNRETQIPAPREPSNTFSQWATPTRKQFSALSTAKRRWRCFRETWETRQWTEPLPKLLPKAHDKNPINSDVKRTTWHWAVSSQLLLVIALKMS